MPIYDVGGHGIAVLSLYSRDRPLSSNWESWARYISQYIAMLTEKIHNARELEMHGRRLLAHEVVNVINTMARSAQKINQYLEELPTSVYRPPNLGVWISDLKVNTDQAIGMIRDWASKRDSIRLDLLSLGMIDAPINVRSRGRSFFRAELNTCIQSFRDEIILRHLELSVNADGSDFVVPITAEYLRIILNNLISNAVKYAAPLSTIICRFRQQPYGRSFYIRNIGVPLTSAEQYRMFDIWFRGPRTKDHVEGSGLGLFIVKRVCDNHGFAIHYDQQPLKGNRERQPLKTSSDNVWHQINLDIPGDLVTDG